MKKMVKKAFAVALSAAMTITGFGGAFRAVNAAEEHPNWIADEPVTFTFMTMEGASQTIPQDSLAREATLEAVGVKLEIQTAPAASYAEKMNISLGTNNFADIIYLDGGQTTVATYAGDEIFEPLLQHVNEEEMPNFYKVWNENPELKKYLIDGELYAFPVLRVDETSNGFGAVIRVDLLEKAGLEQPKTFDELLDVLAKLKEIYPDSTPWIGRKGTLQLLATTSYMLGSGFGSRPNPMYWDSDEGKYIFGPASENFKAVLDYLNRAFEAGVLDPEYATQTQEVMEANLESGKSFFYLDNSGFGQNYTKILQQVEGQEDGMFQILPTLENSFGERRAVSYARVYSGRMYGINAGCKNMDALIKYIDWLYSDEGYAISNFGKEGVSFYYDENGQPKFDEEFIAQFAGAAPSSYYAAYSELGVGLLDLTMLASNTHSQFEIQKILGEFTPDIEEYWDIVAADDAYVEPHLEPAFTSDESERIADILVDLTTYLDQEYDKYIMGKESVDNWDNVIKTLEDMGVRELEDIYNGAEARANGQ